MCGIPLVSDRVAGPAGASITGDQVTIDRKACSLSVFPLLSGMVLTRSEYRNSGHAETVRVDYDDKEILKPDEDFVYTLLKGKLLPSSAITEKTA